MSETTNTLHAIRVAELEAARRVEQARADAAELVAAARREHAEAVAQARLRGRAEARRRLDLAVTEAEREAAEVLAGCDTRVDSLRRSAGPHLSRAAGEMVDLLLAPPLEQGK